MRRNGSRFKEKLGRNASPFEVSAFLFEERMQGANPVAERKKRRHGQTEEYG